MAEVEQLKEELAALKVANQGMREELKGKSVVQVVQTAYKLRKYAGDPKDLKAWISECRHQISLQSLSDKRAVHFILSHLEGDAEQEVKFDLEEDMVARPEEIFSRLEKAFSEYLTGADVLGQFFDRERGPGESLRSFSYALMRLLDRAVSLDGKIVRNKDILLRDRFILKAGEKSLRDHLRTEVRKNPDMNFRDVREEAMFYTEDDHKAKRVSKTSHEMNVDGMVQVASAGRMAGCPTPPRPDKSDLSVSEEKLNKMLECQERQQEQLEQQQKLIIQLLTEKEKKKDNPKKDMVCWFCGKPGHIKTDCYKFKAQQRKGQQQLDARKPYVHAPSNSMQMDVSHGPHLPQGYGGPYYHHCFPMPYQAGAQGQEHAPWLMGNGATAFSQCRPEPEKTGSSSSSNL